MTTAYTTKKGRFEIGTIEDFLDSPLSAEFEGRVQLIFTSPPFPLNRKKKYGNLVGEDYVNWLASLANRVCRLLTSTGSIVMEVGNAWEPGEPVMSTLALRSLLAFLEAGNLNLCQQFICNNPARLPSPAQWVNVDRIRVKDSYTHVWWMSPVTRPKADNRNVLKEYSESMRKLIQSQKYNAGKRPSEHHIGATSFLKDNAGAIPSNVLTFSNTSASDPYQSYCKANGLDKHPARMPQGLAEFFIKFLTDEGDLVFDPFGGSNTTGSAAENLGRCWLATEPNVKYISGSLGRFKEVTFAADLLETGLHLSPAETSPQEQNQG
jgi:DNA modification methylase